MAATGSDRFSAERIVVTGQEFVIQLVGPYGDLNVLHPCCEGNGRTQRAFLEQLSTGAGYALGWSGMDPQRNEAASDESATYFNVNGRKITADFNTYSHGQTKQNYLVLLAHLEDLERAPPPEGYQAPFYKAGRAAEMRAAHVTVAERAPLLRTLAWVRIHGEVAVTGAFDMVQTEDAPGRPAGTRPTPTPRLPGNLSRSTRSSPRPSRSRPRCGIRSPSRTPARRRSRTRSPVGGRS